MKRVIDFLFFQTKRPAGHAAALALVTAILGATVLAFCLALFGVDLFYRSSGVSSAVGPEVADLIGMMRCIAYIILPSLGIAFVSIASAIWKYRPILANNANAD